MTDAPSSAAAPERVAAPTVVVMGVSGSGKSTIGALVADALRVPFLDGDSLHPRANIVKMAAGTPLDDDDRAPWLAEVGRRLAEARGRGDGLVIACSALKRRYRAAILAVAPRTVFLHLHGSRDTLTRRLEGRSGHFMPAALLDSQLATLEPLDTDEPGLVVDIHGPVDAVVATAIDGLRAFTESPADHRA